MARSGTTATEATVVVEQMLRMTQSFVVDPGTPPRTGANVRGSLSRRLAPAIAVKVGH
jgi:hypothetical protein